jgi:uncharacterized protein
MRFKDGTERLITRRLRGLLADDELWAAWNDERGFATARFELIRRRALEGSIPAASMLGYCYDQGFLTRPSRRSAIRWYRVAAQAGEPQAQYNLALVYLDRPTSRNAAQSEYWFRRAALLNHTKAITNYAVALENRGERQRAAKWYEKAVKRGDSLAVGRLEALEKKGGSTD